MLKPSLFVIPAQAGIQLRGGVGAKFLPHPNPSPAYGRGASEDCRFASIRDVDCLLNPLRGNDGV